MPPQFHIEEIRPTVAGVDTLNCLRPNPAAELEALAPKGKL
jgi:hypothetical protein